jgi:hypothetical protein
MLLAVSLAIAYPLAAATINSLLTTVVSTTGYFRHILDLGTGIDLDSAFSLAWNIPDLDFPLFRIIVRRKEKYPLVIRPSRDEKGSEGEDLHLRVAKNMPSDSQDDKLRRSELL